MSDLPICDAALRACIAAEVREIFAPLREALGMDEAGDES